MMVLSAGRPLGINIPAGDDFVSWCMAAIAFLGLAHTFRHGEMIRVGLLIDRLEGQDRATLIEIVALIIGTGFIGFFAWHAVDDDLRSWRFHDMSQGVIAVPLWIPQLGYSGGPGHPADRLRRRTGPRAARAIRRATRGRSRKTAEEVVERAIQSGV